MSAASPATATTPVPERALLRTARATGAAPTAATRVREAPAGYDSSRNEGKTAARQSFVPFRNADRRLQLRLSLAAAYLLALEAPKWLGHSQNDYVRARLGIPLGTFRGWVRCGRYCAQHPELIAALREGHLTLSQVDALARQANSSELPTVVVERLDSSRMPQPSNPSELSTTAASSGDPHYRRIHFRVPLPAVAYLEETFRLARSLLGFDAPDDECLEAIVAEALTELVPTVSLEESRRKFAHHSSPARKSFSSSAKDLSHPPVPSHGAAAQRRRAHRLHRIFLRLLQRRRMLRIRQEDQLLQFLHDDLHGHWGFPSFERFCREILDLPASTAWDRIARARQRHRHHPVALARQEGRLSVVKADALDRLQKQVHLPPSNLSAWIDYAESHTLRRLRSAIEWARLQSIFDYRPWSLAGCPPPTDEQFRTSNRPLEDLLRHPEPEQTFLWSRAPMTTLRWIVSTGIHDLLLQGMATLQEKDRRREEATGILSRFDPPWLLLCRIFRRARKAWMQNIPAISPRKRRIFSRTDWQCAAPECTRRRDLHAHHIQPRSHGGKDEPENLVPLCAFHHLRGVHGGTVKVEGRLDGQGRGLHWQMGLDERGRPEVTYRDEQIEWERRIC